MYHSPHEYLFHQLPVPPSIPTTARCLCAFLECTSNFPQISLSHVCPCPSDEVHDQSISIQPGPVLANLKTNVWQVYLHAWQESFVTSILQQAMLPSFCFLNTQEWAYVCQSCLLGLSAVSMQEYTWSWVGDLWCNALLKLILCLTMWLWIL